MTCLYYYLAHTCDTVTIRCTLGTYRITGNELGRALTDEASLEHADACQRIVDGQRERPRRIQSRSSAPQTGERRTMTQSALRTSHVRRCSNALRRQQSQPAKATRPAQLLIVAVAIHRTDAHKHMSRAQHLAVNVTNGNACGNAFAFLFSLMGDGWSRVSVWLPISLCVM